MDKIILSGLRLAVHLGVSEKERSTPQEVVLDIETGFDTSRAGASDLFGDTVDYSSIFAAAQEAAAARPYALVESMAEEVCRAILGRHPVDSVRVLLRKPQALRDRGVDWAGVEITRRRHG